MNTLQPVGHMDEPGAIWLLRQLATANLLPTEDPTEFLRSTFRVHPGLAKRAGHLWRHVQPGTWASVVNAWCHVAKPQGLDAVHVFAKRLPEIDTWAALHGWLAYDAMTTKEWQRVLPPVMNVEPDPVPATARNRPACATTITALGPADRPRNYEGFTSPVES